MMLRCFFFYFCVGVGAFVIALSQMSSFSSYMIYFLIRRYVTIFCIKHLAKYLILISE